MHYLIGIDEAGRGPWAGPVVAGGFLVRSDKAEYALSSLHGLDDSKKLSHKEREALFHDIERLQFEQECQYAFASRDAGEIDRIGIREANRQSMQDVILSLLQFVSHGDSVGIYIDGCDNYRFDYLDVEYMFAKKGRKSEKTNTVDTSGGNSVRYVIGGDGEILVISAASIVAKVLRDKMMCDFHEEFPLFGFHEHKGYGTRKHHEALLNHGITSLHRKSYAPVKALISSFTSV